MRRLLRIALISIGSAGVISVAGDDAAAADPATQCTTPKTQCIGADGYYASSEDLARLTAVSDPLLKELRTCLDSAGGKHITPTFVVRWDSEGKAVSIKIDVPGYESQPCVAKINAKLQTLQNPHETAIRCEYGCGKLEAPTPPATAAPPTVVVPPPAATSTTTTAPPPAVPEKKDQWHMEKQWYGVQTIVPDAITIAMMGVAFPAKSAGLFGIGYVGFLLATPVVHFAHGNIGPGFGSLALRLFVPWIVALPGALVGLIVGGTQGNGDLTKVGNGATGAATGFVVGFFMGAVGCALIDAGALAYTKERVEGPPPPQSGFRKMKTPTYTLAPAFTVNKDQASLGVNGTF